jgi:crossover junction endodeoxyribonuclease RuvC
MSIIIGIDPGSHVTGYALIERGGNNLVLIEGGVIKISRHIDKHERLRYLYSEVSEILSNHNPEYAAIEDSFYYKNVKTSLYLGQVKGVLILALLNGGCKIFEFSPLEIKKAIVGYGQASKQQVEFMVKRLLKISEGINYSDYYDAIAAAICLSNTMFNGANNVAIKMNHKRVIRRNLIR